MARIKMPRYKMQTLSGPATVAEQGNRLPIPDQRSLSFMSPAQQAALGLLAVSPPRPPQVFPAGSIVLTSTDDGSVRVITPGQFATVFESAPEGGGNFRAATAAVTQVNPTGGTFITTNSDGTINTGNASTHVIMRNTVTGEERVVSRSDAGNAFEQT